MITDKAGTPVHPEWYSDEFGRLLRRAGLRRITLHDSSHATLTLMEHAGVPISIISKWAGHYDSAFTQKTYVGGGHPHFHPHASFGSSKPPTEGPCIFLGHAVTAQVGEIGRATAAGGGMPGNPCRVPPGGKGMAWVGGEPRDHWLCTVPCRSVTFPERSERSVDRVGQAQPVSGQVTAEGRRLWPGSKVAAVALAALAVAIFAGSLVLYALTRQNLAENGGQETIIFAAFITVGLVIAWHRPGNPIGWIILVGVDFQGLAIASSVYVTLARRPGYHLPVGPLVWLDSAWFVGIAAIPLVILLFPEGRPPTRRWRWVLWSYVALVGCYLACTYAAVIIALAEQQTRTDANGVPAFINHPAGVRRRDQGLHRAAARVLAVVRRGSGRQLAPVQRRAPSAAEVADDRRRDPGRLPGRNPGDRE